MQKELELHDAQKLDEQLAEWERKVQEQCNERQEEQDWQADRADAASAA